MMRMWGSVGLCVGLGCEVFWLVELCTYERCMEKKKQSLIPFTPLTHSLFSCFLFVYVPMH